MAISPAILVEQSGLTPNIVTITDDSTGSDSTITKRWVFIQDATGLYLTGDGTVNYTVWSIDDLSISLDILTQDVDVAISVQWLDVDDGVVAEVEDTYPLCQFGKQFFYYLLQLQGLTPGVYQDLSYATNLVLFYANLVGGINAVLWGNDIAAGQNCLNREIQMQQNQSLYF